MHTKARRRCLAFSTAGILFALQAGMSASASLVLTINGTPFTSTTDTIAVTQTNANYSVDIEVGKSNDPGSNPLGGQLSINSTITRTSTAGILPLTITLTDNGFTLPLAPLYTLQSSFSGSLTPGANSATETLTSTVSSPTHSTPLQSFTSGPGTSPVTSNNTNSVTFSGLTHPYTLLETATFSLGPSASARLNGQSILTPEPATVGLLGVGAIGLLRRRRI